jgi:threonine dehydratase
LCESSDSSLHPEFFKVLEKVKNIHENCLILLRTNQQTAGLEIMEQMSNLCNKQIDYLILPIGGGGLSAGVSSYIKEVSPNTKIIGVEPLGAASMTEAFRVGKVIKLDKINNFVDGAAVKKVGALNFPICKKNLDDILLIDEGHVCSKILEMYNEFGYIIEPAGVLSLCALDNNSEIKGKNIVCIISKWFIKVWQ